MQPVPAGWSESFEQLLMGEQFVEVTIDTTDSDVFSDAEVSAIGSEASISNVSGIIGTNDVAKYGTLETDLWLMDRTVAWSDSEYAGYLSSSLSGTDKTFSNLPGVIITLENATSTNCITVEWSTVFNEYPTEFTVTFYDDNDDELYSKAVKNNSKPISVIIYEVKNYVKLEITIQKWCLPGRRARIEHVKAGAKFVFTNNDLQSFSVEQTLSPINAELPTATLNFTIDNSNHEYDMSSDTPLQKLLKRMQKITTRMGITTSSDEAAYINGGTFFLDSWDFPNGGITCSFTARDPLYFMNQEYIYGVYQPKGITMHALATEVLTRAQEASFGEVVESYELGNTLLSYSTTAPLPVCTYAEALQYIAQACGCVLMIDRNGKINIVAIYGLSSTTITELNHLSYPQISQYQKLRRLECNVYNYSLTELESDEEHFPDMDGSGKVTASDAIDILTAAANIGAGEDSGLTPEQEIKADADRDGFITAADAQIVQQFSADVGAGYYTNDVNGWGLFLNIQIGNKVKIYDATHYINGVETIVITHQPSAEINVDVENGSLVTFDGYSNATSITITGEGECHIVAYGFPIDTRTYTFSRTALEEGEIEYIDNPLITSKIDAAGATKSVVNWLNKNRGFKLPAFRADPRIDPGDTIVIGDISGIVETVKYEFTGMFRGTIEGRF